MSNNFNELEIIKLAINMEEEGMNFYSKGAKNTEGEIKEFLETASEQEKVHKNRFEKLYNKFSESASIDDEYIFDPAVEPYFKQLVENTVFEKSNDQAFKDLKSAVSKAIQAEKDSIDFYTKISETTKKSEIKTVLNEIIKEEEEHVKYFENLYDNIV